jgi:hypothetical protein
MMTILLLVLAGVLLLGMAAPTPKIKGVTTLVWGTEGRLGSPAGAIVEYINIKPKNPTGLGEIENGDGAAVADVLLSDGFDASVNCLEDTGKAWPAVGDWVTLTKPNGSGTGTTAYFCYVPGDPDQALARKKEGMKTLALRYRPGIQP